MNYNFKRLVITRLLAENILLLLLQLMGIKFCALSSHPLPVDFAAGTATAFIFMRGYSILPGIWLGTLLACLFSGWYILPSSLLATAYTLQAALLFFLCLRLISPGLVFVQQKRFLQYALLCTVLSILFSPIILSWQANLAGLIIVTLAITHWDMYFPDIADWRKLPTLTLLAVLFFIALAINIISSLVANNPMNNISLFLSLLAATTIFSSIRRVNVK